MKGKYYGSKITKMGDIVFINFSPTKGHEQRPAVVLSNNIFNIKTHMIIVCSITSNIKEFPFHYRLEDTKKNIW